MPIKIQTQKVPAKAILEKKRAASKASTAAKKPKKQYVDEATLFGSQLFEPETKREKEIVIVFTDRFTLDRTRFSACGRFAFRPRGEFYFDLFYCLDLIKDFSDDFIITPNNRIWLFDKITIEELENICVKLVQAEFQEDRKLELERIFKEEKEAREARRLEEEKMDLEYEEAEELANQHENPQNFEKHDNLFYIKEEQKDEPINISKPTEDSNMQLEDISNRETLEESVEKVEETKNPFKSMFSKQI